MPSDRPTIGIDCRFAATNSGIGRYTRELVKHLLQHDDPWNYVLFTNEQPTTNNEQRVTYYSLPTTHYSLGEQFFLPRAIRKANIDLFHSPHFNTPIFSRVPLVATIHDLILHEFPNQASLPKHIAYQILMKHTVLRASHIIAVSHATKKDLEKNYGEDIAQKTSVIYEGISEEFQPRGESEKQRVKNLYTLPQEFFLYVGACKEHKNVQMLIDALPKDAFLVLVTGGKEVQSLRLKENVKILSSIPEEDLPALYSLARCFVSPSLAEGFNFPVLEAMRCGCPVIATNRGSTPEVAGGCALLIEPVEEALRSALKNPPQGNRELAIAHARKFSWEKAAQQTAKIYTSCL